MDPRAIERPEVNDPNENRTRDLPACSAVPQPTAPPRALAEKIGGKVILRSFVIRNFVAHDGVQRVTAVSNIMMLGLLQTYSCILWPTSEAEHTIATISRGQTASIECPHEGARLLVLLICPRRYPWYSFLLQAE